MYSSPSSNEPPLTCLDLSSFDTTFVVDMGVMFIGCTSLVSLDLYNFKTDSLQILGYMFDDCNNLIYIRKKAEVDCKLPLPYAFRSD